MIYVDTSLLVPLIVAETTSARAMAWRDGLAARESGELAISSWTLVEFASAIGLKVRSRALARGQADEALNLLHETIRPSLELIELEPTDLRIAESMLRESRLGLRAGDALHLAVAIRSSARAFATLDKVLARAAAHLGLAVSAI